MKAGDIVEIQPHANFNTTNVLFTETKMGMVKSVLNGDGYCDVLLHNGRVLFLSSQHLKIISENS